MLASNLGGGGSNPSERASDLKGSPKKTMSLACTEIGIESLKRASNDLLQKWQMSKRMNNSCADDDDPTFIGKVELAVAA